MEIPSPPSFTNFQNPHLTPQILSEVAIKEIVTLSSANQISQERTADIKLQLLYIPTDNLSEALNRLFSQTKASIDSDLNPVTVTDKAREINPSMDFAIQVDNGRVIRIVSVWVKIQGMRLSFIEVSLNRLKSHILTSANSDMP